MQKIGARQLLRDAEQFPFGLLIAERTGRICENNTELAAMCGYPSGEELIADTGGRLSELISAEGISSISDAFFLKPDRIRLRRKDGTSIRAAVHWESMQDPEWGEVCALYIAVEHAETASHSYDPVTGLFERGYLLDEIDHRKDLSIRTTICINLSGFRRLNESDDYHAGNQYLRKFGSLLRTVFQTEWIARNFADHFVIFYDHEDIGEKMDVLQKGAAALDETYQPEVEAGIYFWETDRKIAAETTIERAEAALRSIRGCQHGSWCYYSDQIAASERKENYIWQHFEEAVQKGWIEIWLQPVIRSLTGRISSFEALSRWVDPVYGMISPGEFVPVLESRGKSSELARHVIRNVAEMISVYETETHRKCVPVSFNLSREDFNGFDPFAEVEKAVHDYGIDKSQIVIEITESTAMVDSGWIMKTIERFHDAGYKVWMDDFGSDYSSLNILKNYDFDEMKLDQAFLHDLNSKGKVIIRSCVDMAKEVGIRTLCEGAETREQVSFLRDIGCEMIQGYFYSRPLPSREVMKKVKEGRFEPETRQEAMLFDSMSNQPFLQNASWCLSKFSDGKVSMLYQSERFRAKITGKHLLGIPEDGILRADGAEMMPSLVESVEECVLADETIHMDYQESHNGYEIYSRPLAREENSCLCMTIIRPVSFETDGKKGTDRLPHNLTEAVLKASHNAFDAYYENPIALIMVQLVPGSTPEEDDFTYLYTNEAYCRLMGKKRSDIIAKHFSRVFGPKADHDWVRLVAECVRGQKKVEGRKLCSYSLSMLEYMAVPVDRNGCCSIAITSIDDRDADSDLKQADARRAYEEGVLNAAVTRAIAIESPDDSINELLASAGTTAQADRAYIFEYEKNGDISNTYEWCRAGIEPEKEHLQHVSAEIYNRMWGKLLNSHKDVIIHNLDEYAKIDPGTTAILRPQGINRLVVAPCYLENRLIGFIGIDNPPLEAITGLSRLMDAFAGFTSALLRHRDNTKKIASMNFQERITHEAMTKALQKGTPEEEIRELLALIGSQLHAESAYLYERREDGTAVNTYEWAAEGIGLKRVRYMKFPDENGFVFWKALQEKKNVILHDPEECQDDQLRAWLTSRNIQRIIASPLTWQNQLIGAIGLDNPDPDNMENAALLLNMAANFCVGLIQNRESFQRIQEETKHDAELDQAAANAMAVHDPDKALRGFLAETSLSASADRAFICEAKDGKLKCTYQWHQAGTKGCTAEMAEELTGLLEKTWGDALRERKITVLDVTKSVPGQSEELLRIMKQQSIQTLIEVPAFVDAYRGMIVFENPAPNSLKAPYSRFELAAAFTGALLRHRDNIYRLRKLSDRDSMTGTGNRRLLNKFTERLDPDTSAALFYCDLNMLKETNDRYGHEAGDKLIISLSRTLEENCPDALNNGVFRIGGDEFLMVITGLSEEQAVEKEKELRRSLKKKGISVSVGMVWRPDSHESFKVSMEAADHLMYEEKRQWHRDNNID